MWSASEADSAAKVDGGEFGVYTQGMVRPDLQKWSLSLSTLTELNVSDPEPGFGRERLLSRPAQLKNGRRWRDHAGPYDSAPAFLESLAALLSSVDAHHSAGQGSY